MSTSVTFNGTGYTVPATGEEDWGGSTKVDGLLVDLAGAALSKSGGTFALTADVNFGANFGLLSAYFSTRTSNPSTTGLVRLANTETIGWRNAAASANHTIGLNASNLFAFSAGLTVTGGLTVSTTISGATSITSSVFTTDNSSPATAGVFRLSNTNTIAWRNAANSANESIQLNGSDLFAFTGGVVAPSFRTDNANNATTGNFRLANTNAIAWRDAANAANLTLSANGSDNLTLGGAWGTTAAGVATATLTNAPAGASGNPDIWLNILVNGTAYVFPCWTP